MNILYCGDANISRGVMMSVLSLLRNTSEPLNIYILTADISTEGRSFHAMPEAFGEFLTNEARKYNAQNRVAVVNVTELYEAQPPSANLSTRFTPCCMLRLYADLLPDLPGKVLYLDVDVICKRDFSEFYHQSMDECEIAGVLDYYGAWFFRRNLLHRDYLNSGVLLWDMERIRSSGLFADCRAMCAEKRMFMPDQSALNKLSKRKKICPRRYNDQRRDNPDTVFRHFTTTFRFFPFIRTVTVKPWDEARMHDVLNLTEYDPLISELNKLEAEYITYIERI